MTLNIRDFIENSPDDYMVDIRRPSGAIDSFSIRQLKAELRENVTLPAGVAIPAHGLAEDQSIHSAKPQCGKGVCLFCDALRELRKREQLVITVGGGEPRHYDDIIEEFRDAAEEILSYGGTD